MTLFDIDYVLAKTSVPSSSSKGEEEQVFAMLDECPHKKVALSEGRITDCGTSDKRYIQCSYHGMYSIIVYYGGIVHMMCIIFFRAYLMYSCLLVSDSHLYITHFHCKNALNNRMDV